MSNITTLKPVAPLPPDLPELLRELAAEVESGRVTSMVVVYVIDGGYAYMWPSSLVDSLTLTTLAQASALDRMRR
jgi:hypothetical protein